ncbi:MAG: tRNA 2-thiouridine(34) synthase MnmA [Clostridia bacterium]|nr:tRNA 2-thiouridine(34) synthase MnmA [Clostridia bacterium]
MSGGVDSSLAAALLVEAGYEVVGVTMNLWPEEEPGVVEARGGCCGLGAVFDARAVADRLGIRHYVVNFREAFEAGVVAPFASEYARGRTPNPCLLCNRYVKFAALLDLALDLGAERVATGHYARTAEDRSAGRVLLLRAADRQKDQTYALYALTQAQLAHALFPLGGLTKPEVRRMALARGLATAMKPESQELCFVAARGRYTDVLRLRAPEAMTPGPIVDLEGRVVGRHEGIGAYTVGQRRGLGLAGGERLYVVALDPAANAVVVGPESALYRRELVATDLNWIAWEAPSGPVACRAQVRYHGEALPCTVEPRPDGAARVVFDAPVRAPTPGQAIVFYDGDTVLGGGTIAAVPGPAGGLDPAAEPVRAEAAAS